jgi:NAD(P)-dependent dehydrogenase (short-subunit alcohol dehydrogenase family)
MTEVKMFSLNEKVAIVTGALGLIGKNHCYALAEAGANVVVADINKRACEDFAKQLPTRSIGVRLDVTSKESINELKRKTLNEFNSINILINNAAINDMFEDPKAASEQSKFENYPLELWQRSVDVNLTGVFLCSQIIGSVMADQNSGSIINVASTYGMVAPNQELYIDEKGNQSFYKPPAYSATKGAIITFTKYLAAYWGSKGVRVNTLSPGGVQNGQDEHFVRNYSIRTPLKKMAASTDYKGAVVFLSSDASSYMTGSNLVVDGGWTAW